MDYFLQHIAKSMHSEFGNNLNRHCMIFPSRRAGLYFLKYLGNEIKKPVWSPSVLTINDFFRNLSSLQVAGNEILLFELYKVYRKIKKSPGSFDDFFFWGDMLINDFDDIDKYLVDPSQLFRNILDLKNIDQQFGSLEKEQVEVIRQFWINFDPGSLTGEKSAFLSIWGVLNDIYTTFREYLRKKNIAYEGMIFREVADAIPQKLPGNKWDMFHFVGFNALNNCEKKVMEWLRKEGRARFYWDYDSSFITGGLFTSAGLFIRNNLASLGNDMPDGWNYSTFLSSGNRQVVRRAIETSSDVAQAKLIPKLLREIPGLTAENAHHTAVVLPDENLLIPVLTSLPEEAGDINVTMGYPLRQTQIYSLVKALLLLQKNIRTDNDKMFFNYTDVQTVLRHVMTITLTEGDEREILDEIISSNLFWVPASLLIKSERTARIFKRAATPEELSDYLRGLLTGLACAESTSTPEDGKPDVQKSVTNEFIYRIILLLNRLDQVISGEGYDFTTGTYSAILDTMLKNQSVPFSGEPLSGIQIMGLLEARALDFKNLVILSVNEGILPGASAGSSFIPFSLRESFGLPDNEHHNAVYAYHFFRLLERAENVTFVYNSSSEGLRNGEMSRYLLQMKYEPSLCPEFLTHGSKIRTRGPVKESLSRTGYHSALLKGLYFDSGNGRLLSPTAINTWLNCRMRFYYRYVNRLKEPGMISEEIDAALLGTLLHDIMKNLYKDFVGRVLQVSDLEAIIKNKQALEASIERAIETGFRCGVKSFTSGNEIIAADILIYYLTSILKKDLEYAPFTIIDLEEFYSFGITFGDGEDKRKVVAGGKIDRIDLKDGIVRLVDYKTGTAAESVNSSEALFEDDRRRDLDAWLQTLLYCEAFLEKNPGRTVRPSVCRVNKPGSAFGSDRLRLRLDRKSEIIVDDYSIVRDAFLNGLRLTLGTIFGDDEPFRMTSHTLKCGYCPYSRLCQR